jgi:transcriptional regulator GlxA family with amidase domain
MEIVFLLYDGMTALDVIGPHEVLCRLPNAVVQRVAKRSGPVKTDSGVELIADYGFNEVSRADLLLIPGAGNATDMRDDPETLAWVRDVHATTTWTTSVCTGSLILGAAGLVSGLKATTHWAALDRLAVFGAEPTRARVVEAGKVISAAGVTAGIDMALTLTSRIAGQAVAQSLQLAIEYDPAPPFDSGSPDKAPHALVARVSTRLRANFQYTDPVSITARYARGVRGEWVDKKNRVR